MANNNKKITDDVAKMMSTNYSPKSDTKQVMAQQQNTAKAYNTQSNTNTNTSNTKANNTTANTKVNNTNNATKVNNPSNKVTANTVNNVNDIARAMSSNYVSNEPFEIANKQSTEALLNGESSKTASSFTSLLPWEKGYKLTENDLNKISESMPPIILDSNGARADENYVNSLYNSVNDKYTQINDAVTKLNNDYQNRLINDDEYVNAYKQLQTEWDKNAKNAEELNSYKYLQPKEYYEYLKENGTDEEIKNFEAYVGSYDDSMLESLVNSYKATVVDMANRPLQAYDMIRSYIDRDFDYLKDNPTRQRLEETADELRSYTLNGANDQGIRKYSLMTISSLMPMINDTLVALAVGGLVGVPNLSGVASAFTEVEMGIGSANETLRSRLEEGNSFESSFWNAIGQGLITGMVESFNVGNVTNIADFIAGGLGKGAIAGGLAGLPKFTAMAYDMLKNGVGEGIEELAEAYIDYALDYFMGYNPEKPQWGAIGEGGLTDQFIMAGAGAIALGVPSNVALTIDSVKKYNAAGEAVKYWNNFAQYYKDIGEIENAQMCESVARLIEGERQTYYDTSELKLAVQYETDMATPAPTVDEALNLIANAYKLDVSYEIDNISQMQQKAAQSLDTLQNEMTRRGINMNIDQYMELNPEERVAYKQVANFFNENGINNGFAKLMPGQNGISVGDGVILNTDQTRTIDIDALADLDKATYRNAMKTDRNEIFKEAGADASVVTSAAHEITHYAEKSGMWDSLRDMVKEMMGEERFNTAINRLKAIYAQRGVYDVDAEHEAVAFFIQKNLGNMNFLDNLAMTNGSLLGRLYSSVKALFSEDSMAKLENLFEKAIYEAQQYAMNAGTPNYSIGSLFQAVDMTVEKKDEHNFIAYNKNGELVRKLTIEDVKASPLGKMIEESAKNGFTKDYEGQVKMMTALCNEILATQDADMIWAISGSIGFAQAKPGQSTSDESRSRNFAAFTGNADEQYDTTFDVITICTKTQQLIDVASELMMKLGRGLTEREIIDIVYQEVYEAKEPVPCPVCYVFARWVGLGGVLDDIQKFQEKYKGADLEELKSRYEELNKQVDDIAKKRGILKSKAQEELRKEVDWKVTHEYENLYSKDIVEKLGGDKMSAKDRAELESLKKDLDILNDWSWVTRVLLDVKSKKGVTTIKLNEKYLENGDVPPEILFDLNRGEDFSKYAAWNYRTSRGARYGKTISPYSDMVLGQTVMGIASPSKVSELGQHRSAENNPFLNVNATEEQKATYEKAIKNARVQNLKGGSRAQSTSDFRFEFVTDYLLHFLQLQSVGSYGQTYTKVPESVPMLCSVGYEVNMSLMPKGEGYVKAKEGDDYAYYVKGFKGVEDGWYKLDFSSETGINPEEAFYLRTQFDNAQTILVGINDVHNYLSRLDPRIDFIIAYHASGGTEENYVSMMKTVKEAVSENARISYESSQNDGMVKNPTVSQQEAYDLRIKILTGRADNLTEREKEVRDKSKYLSELWKRFYEPGYDEECYSTKKIGDTDEEVGRVVFTDREAKKIYPYEYWDKSSTRETADINGERFAEYCNELGIVPRFSQWVGQEGYWKYLIDRSMYNLDGSYHQQQAVNLDNFKSDFLYKDKMVEGMVQPKNATKSFHREKTPEIVDRAYGKITGQYSLGEEIYNTGDKEIDDIVNQLMDEIINSMSKEEYERFMRTGKFEYATKEEVEDDPEVQDEGLWVKAPEGDYIKIDDGYISNGKTVAWKDERIDALIEENERGNFAFSGHDPYQYHYAIKLSPKEYEALSYLFDPRHNQVWREEVATQPENYGNGEVTPEKLGGWAREYNDENDPNRYRYKRKIDYMFFDATYESGMLKIKEQEGNHRALILQNSGYESMPIILGTDYPLDGSTMLRGMDAGDIKNPNMKQLSSGDYVELTKANRERLIEKFGSGANADIQYSLGEEIVPSDDGGNDLVPPTKVQGEVVDGYGDRKKQQFRESNLEKSTVLNEEQKQRTRDMSAEGGFSYMSVKNKVEVQRAKEYMEIDGVDATFNKFMSNSSPSMKSVVQGEVLLEKLAKDKDPRWEEVAVKLADDATIMGQGLQAYAILQKLSPQNQLAAIKKTMDRMQSDLNERYGNKAPQLELKPELIEELMESTPENSQKVRDKIQKDLIEQMPITFTDMINSWRYLAMLGNPRTHVRNFFGNAVFMPAIGLKNAIGTVLEKMAGDKLDYKTKSFVSRFSSKDRPLIEAGKKAYEEYRAELENNQKYEQKGFTEKTWLGKGLNWANKKNSALLDFEDQLFSKDRFALSYAQFLKANDLDPNNLSAEMQTRAILYATNESLKATYRDANAYANWLNKLETDPKLKTLGFFKKAVLPFTKTPFNIVRRGVEYSGIGLIKSIYDGATKVRNGTMDVNTWLDEMASGLSGVALMGLGYLLKQLGIFRTKDDDKDRKKYYDAELGEQDYAIDLGKGTYTIDWMSPVIMPLAIGADFAEAFDELGNIEDADTGLNAMLSIFSNIADPIVETSMLSSLKDAMSSYSQEGGAYFGDVVTSAIASAIGQLFPTFGGQIARTIDDTRRTTSPNKGLIDKTWRQIRNKIPGLSFYNEPYINKRGEEQKTEGGNIIGRAFLNMISPGYYSSKDADEYDDELYRLYDATGDIDALPSSTVRSFTYDGETQKLYGKDYTEFQRTMYKTESDYVNQFIDSKAYKSLDDQERIKTIEDIRKYAREVAKKQYLGEEYESKDLTNAQAAMSSGVDLYQYYDYLNNAGTKQADKMKYLEESGFSEKEKEALWNLNGYKTSYQAYYAKNMGKSSSKSSSKKSSSKSTKTSSGKSSTKSSKGTVSTGKAVQSKAPLTQKSQIKNTNYLKAYSNTFKSARPSTGGSSVTCPNCGNKVTPYNGRCPICGANL